MWLRAGNTLATSADFTTGPYPLEQLFITEVNESGSSTAEFTFGENKRWSVVTIGGNQENYVYWGDRQSPIVSLPPGFLVEPGQQTRLANLFVNITLQEAWDIMNNINPGGSSIPDANPISYVTPLSPAA
jgi:hypothetical protein